jgi:hypothetical protein
MAATVNAVSAAAARASVLAHPVPTGQQTQLLAAVVTAVQARAGPAPARSVGCERNEVPTIGPSATIQPSNAARRGSMRAVLSSKSAAIPAANSSA